ncbi:unnamed protein product [Withania somnifera]
MKHSWNVACEVLRLAPPAQGAFRQAISDFTFNGFSIPKGWKIYWSTYSTHKSPEFFPEPENLILQDLKEVDLMCPGMEYARLEILIFMHHLVKRFKCEKIIADEKLVVHSILIPANGLPVRLYRHDK